MPEPQSSGRRLGGNRNDAYSPLVSFASAQAAQMIGRIAPSVAARRRRRCFATCSRPSSSARRRRPDGPRARRCRRLELVTPPSPRPDSVVEQSVVAPQAQTSATQLAERVEQRAQIVEPPARDFQQVIRELVGASGDRRTHPLRRLPSVPASSALLLRLLRLFRRLRLLRLPFRCRARARSGTSRGRTRRAGTRRGDRIVVRPCAAKPLVPTRFVPTRA